MSAAEIIELIKKLPPEEKAEVVAFVKQEESSGGVGEPRVKYASDDEFERAAKKVFAENKELLRRLAR